MYKLRPSYCHFVFQKLLISISFMITFIIASAIFRNYETGYLISVLLIISYFFILFIYYPLKFKNTYYQIRGMFIVINTGAIFKHKIYIPCKAVNYIEKRQNLLQRLSGCTDIVLYSTGSKSCITDVSYYALRMIEIKLNEAKYYYET